MKLLGVGSTTIKRWADDGVLPYNRTPGGHRRFRMSEIEDFAPRHNGHRSALRTTVISGWFELLRDGGLSDVIDKVRALPDIQGDWFAAGDMLGAVFGHLGRRWDNEECSVLEANVVSAKLVQAVATVSAGLPVATSAPRALVAAVPGDHHAVGAAIAQLCLRSRGYEAFMLGSTVAAEQLKHDLAGTDFRLLVLSASSWQTDIVTLKNYFRHLAPVCREQAMELVLGGKGAWPAEMDYGHMCRTFRDFRGVLDAIAKPSSSPT